MISSLTGRHVMSSLSEVFSAREYLKTYYPIDFDQEQLLSVIDSVEKGMVAHGGVLDTETLSLETGLSDEEIENAAIFNFLRKVSTRLLQTFPRGEAVLLDVGGGPTIYQHIPLCLNVSAIVHAEFREENRVEVQKYLDHDEETYLWGGYFSVVRRMLCEDQSYQEALDAQGKSSDVSIRECADRIRKILFSPDNEALDRRLVEVLRRHVVSCDVFSPSLELDGSKSLSSTLGEVTKDGLPDVVSAHFLIESATDNLAQWERGVLHLIEKLRPGGYFIMTAIRNASWYRVGSKKVAAVSVNEQRIKKFLEEHGIVIEDMQVLQGSDQDDHGYDGMVFVFGRKIYF